MDKLFSQTIKKPKFWIVLIVIAVVLIIGVLSNPPEDEDASYTTGPTQYNYVNEEYGFTFEVPENWKFKVIEDGIISFVYSEYQTEDSGYQEFFTIGIVTKEEYFKALSAPPMTGVFLGEKDNLVYILNVPLDNIILDREKAQEYHEMSISVDEIKERFYLNDSDSIGDYQTIDMTVEEYAWAYIDNEIGIYNQWQDIKIVDKEITKLEKLSTFDNILSGPVELWMMDYRLKPENPENVVLAGGLEILDGWLVDYGINGKPHLTFTYENGNLVYLGNANAIEFDLDTLASQEAAIRIMLESMGLIANETYEGNHVVIKFPLSTGETAQLLLSQPVKQGDHGIWTVERWMDGSGYIYHHVSSFEDDISIDEYHRNLQEEVDNGHKPWILDPVEVGFDYIYNTLGQILVTRADLDIINPATLEDFLLTPESNYIGYIIMMTIDERLFYLDKVEFLTLEDEERASELGLDIDYDMPSGFYIHNPDTYPAAFDVYNDTNYLILDWTDLSQHKSVTKEEFVEYNDSLGYNPLYHIYTRGGHVTLIKEQYIP